MKKKKQAVYTYHRQDMNSVESEKMSRRDFFSALETHFDAGELQDLPERAFAKMVLSKNHVYTIGEIQYFIGLKEIEK